MANPQSLQSGQFYHIFNRGNNRDDIFIEPRNYDYFLRLYERYVEPVAATFAYCLMRNHFHMLVRINPAEDARVQVNNQKHPSQAFSNFFNAYARTINQTYRRTGSLFQRPFGRVPISSSEQLCYLVVYIHHNAQKHGFVDRFFDWPYSSYSVVLSDCPTWLKREEVIGWFSGLQAFIDSHQHLRTEDLTGF